MIVFDAIDNPGLVSLLQNGAVGVVPTDTIYGLAAAANNAEATSRLYELKQRKDEVRSGTVIAANIQQLITLGLNSTDVQRVAHAWPNSLSIELPVPQTLAHLYQSGPHRAFRVVANPQIRAFLEKTGPLLTTSVNTSGMLPATNLAQARAYFGDKVDFYADGGELKNRPPSTVAIIRNGKLEVVRPGAVTIDDKGNIV